MVDHLLDVRLGMSLDDIMNKSGGGGGRGGSRGGRGRKFASHSARPYDRPAPSRSFDRPAPSRPYDRPSHKSSGPPPRVDFNVVTNKLYVNNLSYETSWQDLKDHMRSAGNVIHTEIFSDQAGRSKGCGLVEYATRHDAINALKSLNDTELGGRLIYLREDREDRGTAPPPPPRRMSDYGREAPQFGRPAHAPHAGPGATDLKDQFRSCGNVIRADVLFGPDGRPKGTGVILFESPSDARRAINQMDEVDFNGRVIYVREDKFEGSA